MLKNYFTVAWRNLLKNKVQTIINILGLSVGIGVTLLIALWMYDELAFDRQNPHYDRIARVIQNVQYNGEVQTWNSVPYPLADELRQQYGSDFKQVVLSTGKGDHLVGLPDKKLNIKGTFAEPQIANLLDLKMKVGHWNDLNGPSPIFLSESTAKAYFGSDDPTGKTLRIDNTFDVRVAGVYDDLPYNSTFGDLGFIGTWQTLWDNTNWIRTIQDPWRPNAFDLLVQLTDNANLSAVSLKIRDAKLKRVNARLAKMQPALFLFPMSKWHLYSEFKDGKNFGGRIQYVWLFGIIGAFVLLLACINFMNLSTARSEARAREVGIRKAIGSQRHQLVYQFLCESILVTGFAFLLCIAMVRISLPFFNEVSLKHMAIPYANPWFWASGVGLSFITGLIAGSYPAFYLSSFQPVRVLKGGFKISGAARGSSALSRLVRNLWTPRQILVILQFTVSVILIIGTVVVYLQIQYAKDRPIGFSRNGLVSVTTNTSDIHKHMDAVQHELMQRGAIVAMAEGDGAPSNIYNSTSGISWPGRDPNQSAVMLTMNVSRDYGKTVNWQIIDGRDFSRDFPTDTSAFVLNEAAVRVMGLKNPVGQTITAEKQPFRIIGVVKDIISGSAYEAVQPCIYTLSDSALGAVVFRLNPAQRASRSISAIGSVFKEFDTQEPFDYKFADDEYAQKFDNEQRIGELSSFFAVLAIFICCLGLFGMATFMAEQRTKEIGVRKVLGASVISLWGLLSRDFVVLVMLSLCFALPTAYILMHSWLQHYTYRAAITWWSFILPATGALLITMITISFQSLRAATANPVRSLRAE